MQQRFPGRDLPEFAVGIGLHSGAIGVGRGQVVALQVTFELHALQIKVGHACQLEQT